MKGGSTSIGFSVDDLDKVIQELKAKGVMFTSGVVDDGQVRIASFMDPDGNQLYLSQSRWG
jgi:predicted enzyme related to lactoylglutathione lyase